MSVARAVRLVAASPQEAFEAWADTSRWPSFIEGLSAVESIRGQWPERGGEIVWRSVAGGRGVVTETVIRHEPGALLETHVEEERLTGIQTVEFGGDEEGALVELRLDYRLHGGGPLRWLVDALFIRRAEAEALDRTLRRFAAEAA